MEHVPLLYGPRVVVAPVPPGGRVLHPPPPAAPLADVPEAVAEALAFPLAGQPLGRLVTPGGRATIVVEPPVLPIPGAQRDPRGVAVAAVADALADAGVALERQTILVAGGLQRRSTPQEIGHLVTPEFRRRFRGRLVVHDVELEGLVELGAVRVNPALVETDLVVVVTAAESVLHGGATTLLAAASAGAALAPEPESLLETGAAAAWRKGLELERALQARVPLIGVALALNHPLPTGALRGYPYDDDTIDRLTNSPLRRMFAAVPGPLRRPVIRRLPLELRPFGVFAGPPAVAHAEALLRAIDVRATDVPEPLDALVVPIPPTTASLPRERPNPVSVAYLGLGLALRLWRGRPPLREGGTVILLHQFRRAFTVPGQNPYRAFFRDAAGLDPDGLADAQWAAGEDGPAVDEYRRGRTCHPLLPFREWAACRPAIARAGSVIVAGCRDAAAARQLGFVPAGSLGTALDMAHGVAGGAARVGFLLGPPYFPLQVEG